jgi:cell shape-determining protein MreD
MNRLILRNLNLPILILLTAIAIALQTSLFASWPLRYFQPDFVLLVVIWCALHRKLWVGGLITLLIGEAAELHSSVPQGVFLVSYMAVYLLVRAADKLFQLPTENSMVKLTLFCSTMWRGCVMLTMVLLSGHRNAVKQMFVQVVPGAVMAAVFGIWVYRALARFDVLTFIDTNNENPDEFQIENLGL